MIFESFLIFLSERMLVLIFYSFVNSVIFNISIQVFTLLVYLIPLSIRSFGTGFEPRSFSAQPHLTSELLRIL